MERTILLVDDEKDITEMLRYNLEKEGYRVLTACNGKEGLTQAKRNPDLILLDVMMPQMDGWEVFKELRRDQGTSEIPILFLTAKGSEVDEVLGLELGADDYITKPISIRRLLARLKVVLRRREAVGKFGPSDVIRIDDLEINIAGYKVTAAGRPISLTRREFETLAYLASNRGRVISREMLLSTVWGDDVRVVDRTVDVHISKIRDKLGSHGGWIETVKGVGYRMKM